MDRRELSDDLIEAETADPSKIVELLKKFNINEYYERSFLISGNPSDTTVMTRYIELLRQHGLDIGKGNSEFGYRMPLPKGEVSQRNLYIFRRR